MAGLIVILLCACKLAFQASSTCVKIKEFLVKNEARKAYLHVHKRIIIMLAIYERGLYLTTNLSNLAFTFQNLKSFLDVTVCVEWIESSK